MQGYVVKNFTLQLCDFAFSTTVQYIDALVPG